ncbi:hypothetical protein E3T24_04750 [Cryobacterium sp. TmT2-59]|uniref:hypothetical protein n=1 Tax=Cryobacterium sp. TmT2-59 TaxID=1259264 RepID=UPI00106A9CC9|nr:hypothetical protein [Cryobacterium sp. TmT2-59]TFC87504.1 hypothetical protein E3T24_04750 [Cryobacterium sp. TmT2-59]
MMTSVDQEWYWLQRISEQLEAASRPDGWAAVQAIGTLLLASFAAYVAWKSHKLSAKVAADETARRERAEREEFRSVYQRHLDSLVKSFFSSAVGDMHWSGYGINAVTVHAIMLGGDRTTGAGLLLAKMEEFEDAASGWDRDESSTMKFSESMQEMIELSAVWARDGRDAPAASDS